MEKCDTEPMRAYFWSLRIVGAGRWLWVAMDGYGWQWVVMGSVDFPGV